MPARIAFEYAIVRVVPRVEREEFVNSGAIVYAEKLGFLAARIELDEVRLRAIAPDVDLELVQRHISTVPLVCGGGEAAGPIGALPVLERWRWLTAPRSTILQTSPAHSGLCESPDSLLEHLLDTVVRAQPLREHGR